MASNSNDSKRKWVTIGRLWKANQNPDRLRGQIEIEGVKFEVFAFVKTPAQKKFNDEEDVRIAMIIEESEDEGDNPFIDQE